MLWQQSEAMPECEKTVPKWTLEASTDVSVAGYGLRRTCGMCFKRKIDLTRHQKSAMCFCVSDEDDTSRPDPRIKPFDAAVMELVGRTALRGDL